MTTKRRIVSTLSILLSLGSLVAEDQPEIAYRILSGYIEKKEAANMKGTRIAGGVLTGTGAFLLGGAATTWFAGDSIASNAGTSFDPQTKMGVTIGLGVGGLALATAGLTLLTAKPHDYRAEYGEVFRENDAQVREAMSVAVLRDLSIKAEKKRITGAITTLLVPVLSAAITAGVNVTNGKIWYDGVMSSVGWSAWSIAGGVSSLFGSSEEERLYSKYRAAADAMYGDRAPGK